LSIGLRSWLFVAVQVLADSYPEFMRWLPFLAASCALAQTYQVEPKVVKQGDIIRVSTSAPAALARMLDRTIRLFPQSAGNRFGLMPIAANEKPGTYPLQILSSEGAVLNTTTIAVSDAHFPEQNVTLNPKIQALRPAPGELETVAAFRKAVSDIRHWQEPFVPPITGCLISPYGVKRLHNGKPTGNFHGGIDQRSPAGQPIHVIADGTVRLVREYNLHGNVVGVDHGQGLGSIYLHMSKFAVAEGAIVKKGDVVGYVGSTGRSTAPHLHWGVYVNGVAVNPTQWTAVKPCASVPNQPKTKRRTR
jgi:murein DD-endopeptidase MepM/ murein hydrolase activator NlpD